MADEQAQEKGQKKSHMKLFIIIGVAIAVAVGASVGIMMFMGGKKEGEHKEAKKAHSEATAVHPLDPFIVNIYDGQELRYLKLKVEIEVAGEEAKNEIAQRQAQIRDAILVILTTKTLQDVQYLQGKTQLKQEIMAAISKIVTPGNVKQVFFTDFVVQ
jgi:flagellar FliL protein